MELGIDADAGRVYEGQGRFGRLVVPQPVMVPARFVNEGDEPRSGAKLSDVLGSPWRFREDSFDPIARIRRGRFYRADGPQPSTWRIWRELHPLSGSDHDGNGFYEMRLDTYFTRSVWLEFVKGRSERALVLLGADDRFTAWSIADIETIVTGEELITLRAHTEFGLLPRLREGVGVMKGAGAMKEALECLLDDFHRASPDSVVDRAREAATRAALVYLQPEGRRPYDLAKLADGLFDEGKRIAANTAHTLARLHSRTKGSQRRVLDVRPVRQQDADFAIRGVGLILCELGLADWP